MPVIYAIVKNLLNFFYIYRKCVYKPKNEIRKILLFFISPGIGDAVISSFFIRGLKAAFPSSEIYVLTTKEARIIANNKAIKKYIEITCKERNNLHKLVWRLPELRREQFDLLVDLPWNSQGLSISRIIFLYAIKARMVLAANTFGFSFIKSVEWNFPYETVRDVYAKTLTILGQSNIDFHYEVSIEQPDIDFVSLFIQKNNLDSFILFNPKASLEVRSLSLCQTVAIANAIAERGNKVLLLNCCQKEYFNKGVYFFEGNIFQIAALIKRAHSVLTVDTATLHLADIWGKPMIALYSDNNGFGNAYVWHTHAPITKQAIVLHADLVKNIPEDKITRAILSL